MHISPLRSANSSSRAWVVNTGERVVLYMLERTYTHVDA
jgi:hypothetical protein